MNPGIGLPVFLVSFPLAAALVLLFVRQHLARDIVVKSSAVILGTTSVLLLAVNLRREAVYYTLQSEAVILAMLVSEAALAVFVFALCLRYRKPLVALLVLVQAPAMIVFEIVWGPGVSYARDLFVDKLSATMGVIVGVLGSLIAIYSVGYMREYHERSHRNLKDTRPLYFFLVFVFLSAMLGLVFSNNLLWLYFFWGITTLCSFFLIGYDRSRKAADNAFLALALNLLGELAFAAAVYYLYFTAHTVDLGRLISLGRTGALLPASLLAVAGLTKSAQMPFSSWLLGAMVAPTPVSALLHSSTMVKAGVYLMVRVASVLQGTVAGLLVALVGGITYLLTSFIAVSRSDAKRVLAYSTISNLGLVTLCAGIGTYEAVWAAILLIVFHAVAKCLLFLGVGVIEPVAGGRDIEQMSGLLVRMPGVTVAMLVGMAGMFLAPFGMLISKVVVLKALSDVSPILTGLVAFGSGTTLFFWVKWMGQLVSVADPRALPAGGARADERIVLYVLALLTVAVTLLFPIVSSFLIDPYVASIYAREPMMSRGNILIMTIMMAMVMLFLLSLVLPGRRARYVQAYMGGANLGQGSAFRGAMGSVRPLAMQNYYLTGYFDERRLFLLGTLPAALLVPALLAAALAGMPL